MADSRTVTVKDVVAGLAHMEMWSRELRLALSTMDQGQPLGFRASSQTLSAPRVSGGLCPPPDGDTGTKPKKPRPAKKK